GLLGEEQHRLATGALELSGQTAADVAIPTADLVTVRRGATVAELESLCAETGFSRFPVAGESGELDGYLHLKDLLGVEPGRRHEAFDPKWIRPWVSSASDDSLRRLLATLRRRGVHLARVVDPHSGQMVGVAALEDVLEEIVGEVSDVTQQ
ncbi:MAG: CBS domain-containing protein, partial [Nocardioidaceae bacterium]